MFTGMKSNNSPTLPQGLPQRVVLVLARFVTALSLSLWIGGMAFFGIMAAPVLFHPEKSGIARSANTATIAPQMVSAMLTRFGTLTNICIVLMVIGCLMDGILSGSLRKLCWRAQAVLTVICLVFAQYLNVVLLPQTKAQQAEILPIIARADRGEVLSNVDKARRVAFDTGHKEYQNLATFNLYLLMAMLLILMGRTLPSAPLSSENDSRQA